jgi:hypothetical protein
MGHTILPRAPFNLKGPVHAAVAGAKATGRKAVTKIHSATNSAAQRLDSTLDRGKQTAKGALGRLTPKSTPAPGGASAAASLAPHAGTPVAVAPF